MCPFFPPTVSFLQSTFELLVQSLIKGSGPLKSGPLCRLVPIIDSDAVLIHFWYFLVVSKADMKCVFQDTESESLLPLVGRSTEAHCEKAQTVSAEQPSGSLLKEMDNEGSFCVECSIYFDQCS